MTHNLDSPIFGLSNRYWAVDPEFNVVFSTLTNPKREKASITPLVDKIQMIAQSTLQEFERLDQMGKNKARVEKVKKALYVVGILKGRLISKRNSIGGTSIFSRLIRYFRSSAISNYTSLINKLESAEKSFSSQQVALHNKFAPNFQKPNYMPPPMYDSKDDFIAKSLLRKFGFPNNSPLVEIIKKSHLFIQDLVTPTQHDKDSVARILFSYLKEKHPSKSGELQIQETLFFTKAPEERVFNSALFETIEKTLYVPPKQASHPRLSIKRPPEKVPSPSPEVPTPSPTSSQSIGSISPDRQDSSPKLLQRVGQTIKSKGVKLFNFLTNIEPNPPKSKSRQLTSSPIYDSSSYHGSFEAFVLRG
ncbi:MAG: hypothetical protein FJZ59_03425 [Chlamydiae bacterium]|nr:hypothetical protein [Chlamydiota bacterium]